MFGSVQLKDVEKDCILSVGYLFHVYYLCNWDVLFGLVMKLCGYISLTSWCGTKINSVKGFHSYIVTPVGTVFQTSCSIFRDSSNCIHIMPLPPE